MTKSVKIKTLDDFDFDFQPGINRKEILELYYLGFVDRKENILFVGTSGVGKTHLATAIGIASARARYSTYFISFEGLISKEIRKFSEDERIQYFPVLKECIMMILEKWEQERKK